MPSSIGVFEVPPGRETGIYYITVCNLPFGTDWQQLKDWLRSVCSVDHIELFPQSTSGWIRLMGEDNFERAWSFVNSAKFLGRTLVASDKNRDEYITVKEITYTGGTREPKPSKKHSSSDRQRASRRHTAGRGGHGDESSTVAAKGSGTRRGSGLNPAATPYMPQPGSGLTLFYCGRDESAASSNSHEHSSSEPPQPAEDPTEYPAESGEEQTPEYLPAEPRRLYLSPFPQQGSSRAVMKWIHHKTGIYATQIVSTEVPKNTNTRYLRGYAFVLFKDEYSANAAMDLLNRAKYGKQRINARMTVEGVTWTDPISPTSAAAPTAPTGYHGYFDADQGHSETSAGTQTGPSSGNR